VSSQVRKKPSRPRLLAIASGGGHWEQLMKVREAFHDSDVTYATTIAGLGERSGVDVVLVPDCNRHEKIKGLWAVWKIFLLILRMRPNVVVTTGALPGFLAILIGKGFGARTLWLDSVANAEELSMAGRLASRHVDRMFTQWPTVAAVTGAEYHGAVL